MTKVNRDALRRKAKKAYKEATKDIPKRRRIPFSQYFKEFKNSKTQDQIISSIPDNEAEDFDFEDFINVNEISDDDLEDTVDKDEE